MHIRRVDIGQNVFEGFFPAMVDVDQLFTPAYIFLIGKNIGGQGIKKFMSQYDDRALGVLFKEIKRVIFKKMIVGFIPFKVKVFFFIFRLQLRHWGIC